MKRLTLIVPSALAIVLFACYHIPRDEFNYPLRPHDITETPPPSGLQEAARKDLRRSATFAKLSKQVIFPHASAELTDDSKEVLNQIAYEMKGSASSFERIRISGFTDASGSTSRNLRLSQLRADNVRKYLISKGVPSSKLEAIGMGSVTYDQDLTNKGQSASDRRVDFEIVQ